MRRIVPMLFLAAPTLLLGCATREAPVPGVTPEQQRACEAQANQDPTLKEMRAASAGRLDFDWQYGPKMQQVQKDAVTRCLRDRGLAPRGGVERLR